MVDPLRRALPVAGDGRQGFIARHTVTHQPATHHRPGASDAAPAVEVDRVPVSDSGIEGVEDANHDCRRMGDAHVADGHTAMERGDTRIKMTADFGRYQCDVPITGVFARDKLWGNTVAVAVGKGGGHMYT